MFTLPYSLYICSVVGSSSCNKKHPSCSKSLTIETKGQTQYSLSLEHDLIVFLNGHEISEFPHVVPGISISMASSLFMKVSGVSLYIFKLRLCASRWDCFVIIQNNL